MALPRQTIALLDAARELVKDKVAETVLLLTETKLDWDEVRRISRAANCWSPPRTTTSPSR